MSSRVGSRRTTDASCAGRGNSRFKALTQTAPASLLELDRTRYKFTDVFGFLLFLGIARAAIQFMVWPRPAARPANAAAAFRRGSGVLSACW